jgi:hypothetical protein
VKDIKKEFEFLTFIMVYELAKDAETRIHKGINEGNIAIKVDPNFYAEANTAWHPLADAWVKEIKPLVEPDPPTVAERCVADCKEREKNRKRECAEIRKRVQVKLKELGCLSKVISADKAQICGLSKKSAPKKVAAKTATSFGKKKKKAKV